jgi:ubiquinone/menaquinone biosynthesis C-methylase UbiE
VLSERPHRPPVLRLALFLAGAILIFLALNTIYSFTNTVRQLDAIEAKRDQWQRPSDVIHALELRDGSSVVDLGSGAGYFALKLSPIVGERGQVLAVDLRRLSLFFLWTRALLGGKHDVHVQLSEEDDPHLPIEAVDAVLICNTYHELSNPGAILNHTFRSLRSGGRVVVVDRAPRTTEVEHSHGIPLAGVERQLRQEGFDIIDHDELFIAGPEDKWWLIVARKP